MGNECSKAVLRRLSTPGFVGRYFVGDGIDIGAGGDSLSAWLEHFPLIHSLRSWDLVDGDAMDMRGLANGVFDFVHSSHCLEHLLDPSLALANWWRILKPGGHLVLLLPDEYMYEHGRWPSHNPSHLWSFRLGCESMMPRSRDILEIVAGLPHRKLLRAELLDSTFRECVDARVDQTQGVGECGIEVVVRKGTII